MGGKATIVRADFRSRGYDEEDREVLGRELGALGPVRLRPLHLPEAGGSFEIWLTIEFIGTSLTAGLLGHVVGKFYDQLTARIRSITAYKRQRNGEPELELKVSYDDVDIVFTQLADHELILVPQVADEIRDHLNSKPLVDKPISRIVIGMSRDGETGRWYEPNSGNGRVPNRGVWGISMDLAEYVSHVYDTGTRILGENPSE